MTRREFAGVAVGLACPSLAGFAYPVRIVDAKGRTVGLGGGFFLSAEGTFLTAAHLFRQWREARAVSVDFVEDRVLRVRPMVEITAASSRLDVVIGRVALDGSVAQVPPVGPSPRVGAPVTGLRWGPLGTAVCTSGRVLATSSGEIRIAGERFFTPGSSGSPVFNAAGAVVAVAMAIEGLVHCALPVNRALGIGRLAAPVSVEKFISG